MTCLTTLIFLTSMLILIYDSKAIFPSETFLKKHVLYDPTPSIEIRFNTQIPSISFSPEAVADDSPHMILLRIRLLRGIKLAVRDLFRRSSDPYVVFSMGDQTVKSKVVKRNCDPEWNDELTLAICPKKTINPVHLKVYDKNTFMRDEKMGNAVIDLKPILKCVEKTSKTLLENKGFKPNDGTVLVSSVFPMEKNSLVRESVILWKKGKLVLHLLLRLENVECGEVELELELLEFFLSPSSTSEEIEIHKHDLTS